MYIFYLYRLTSTYQVVCGRISKGLQCNQKDSCTRVDDWSLGIEHLYHKHPRMDPCICYLYKPSCEHNLNFEHILVYILHKDLQCSRVNRYTSQLRFVLCKLRLHHMEMDRMAVVLGM